jgi:hypothetical protein
VATSLKDLRPFLLGRWNAKGRVGLSCSTATDAAEGVDAESQLATWVRRALDLLAIVIVRQRGVWRVLVTMRGYEVLGNRLIIPFLVVPGLIRARDGLSAHDHPGNHLGIGTIDIAQRSMALGRFRYRDTRKYLCVEGS